MAGPVTWPRPGNALGRANSNSPAPWVSHPGAGPSQTCLLMFAQVTCWDNLLLAFRKASAGKRGRPDVAAFEHRLEDNLFELQAELQNGRYRPGAYVSFYIHEPKRRLISAAPFRDRVVHHALCNVIEPLLERSFVTDSYANRLGKGTHRALGRAQAYARRFRYVLQLDIRQFFPSIDHAILQELLSRKIVDPAMLWLIDEILASGAGVLAEEYCMVYFPGDDLFAANRPRGLPIGNLTSQFWGNVYLNPLDHCIKRELRCLGYVRYVDDLLLFANEKSFLWEWMEKVAQRLATLRLTVHPGAHPRPVMEGIPFLGFVIFPNQRRLKRRKGVQFQRRLRAMRLAWQAGELTTESLAASLNGWLNHVRYGNTCGLQKAVLCHVPQEVLALIHCKQEIKSMNEIAPLAATLTSFLAPVIPYLMRGAETAAEEMGQSLGAGVSEGARALWNRLWPQIEGNTAVAGAARDLAAAPEDPDAQAQLRLQLKKLLESDTALAQDLARLLEAAGQPSDYHAKLHGGGAIAQGPGAVAAGESGVAVGRDVKGNVTLGGKEKNPAT